MQNTYHTKASVGLPWCVTGKRQFDFSIQCDWRMKIASMWTDTLNVSSKKASKKQKRNYKINLIIKNKM